MQSGIERASALGTLFGPFHHATTSMIPRAIRTARAMGREPDERHRALGEGGMCFEVHHWSSGVDYWRLNLDEPSVSALCSKVKPIIHDAWRSLDQAQRGLIITHGGLCELSLLSLIGDQPIIGLENDWHCGYGEGFLVEGDEDGRISRVSAIRA